MPNQDDSIILSQSHVTQAADYSYGMISGINSERSHKSQLIFLYRYPTLGDGTLVEDVTWNNWYDPYLIPESLITLNQAIKTAVVGNLTTVVVTAADGTSYNMPSFTLTGENVFEIQRSQDIDSRIIEWAPGSRVTSDGLNNSVDQLFKSLQEINSRTVSLESDDKLGYLIPGNYGDLVVNNDGSITVVDDSHNHIISNVDGLQAALDTKVDALEAAAAAPVQDIVGGVNVTVTDNGLGKYTVNSSNSVLNLTDTYIAQLQAKQVLYYNGSVWRNVTLAATDIPSLPASQTTSGTFDEARIPDLSATYATASHTHNAGDITSGIFSILRIPDLSANKITSGTFADARISESSVTQHEAAFEISTNQLTSGSLSIDLNPSSDLTYSIGTEDYRWLDIHGDLDGAVTFRAKNNSGVTLNAGDIVYIDGVSGTVPTVALADCTNSAKMPAFGMVRDASVNPNAETHIVTLGSVENVDVPSGTYTLGTNIYVGTGGAFTASAPTGEGSLIQNIGYVARVNSGGGTNGIIKVGGAGRTNAVPNLNQDKIFLGNSSNQAVPTALSSVGLSKFNNDANLIDSPLVDLATLTDVPAGSINAVVTLTQAEYDDISAPDPNTIYVVSGGTTVGASIQDSYLMLIEAPPDSTTQAYTIDGRVAAGRTITAFTARTTAGTINVALKNLTTGNTITSLSGVSSSGSTNVGPFTYQDVAENARLAIEISSGSSASFLELVVEYLQ